MPSGLNLVVDDMFEVAHLVGPGADTLFEYLALGGDLDLAEGSFTIDGGDGINVVTGLGFQPDLILVWWQTGYGNAPGAFGFGASDGTDQACVRGFKDYHGGMANKRVLRDDAIAEAGYGAGTSLWAATVTHDSGGFTFTATGSGYGGVPVMWVALRSTGGSFKVGVESQKTSTGTKATSGVGGRPRGLMFASANTTTSGTILDAVKLSFGFAAEEGGVIEQAGCWSCRNSGYAARAARYNAVGAYEASLVMADAIENVVFGGSTCDVKAIGVVQSIDSDGFTIDWTTADAVARLFLYVAFVTDENREGGGDGDICLTSHTGGPAGVTDEGCIDSELGGFYAGHGYGMLFEGGGICWFSSWDGGTLGGSVGYASGGFPVAMWTPGSVFSMILWLVKWFPLWGFIPQIIRYNRVRL